ncbi:MAG: TolC family protein, partial [Nostoc sp.]
VGIQGSLTLFDGGAARARAAQSKANIAIAENQFASQRDQIRFNVEQYYSQLQSNLNNVQTSSVALNQAREALDLARLRFQAGVGTQTEVIAAESDLTTAEGNRVTAILNYNIA